MASFRRQKSQGHYCFLYFNKVDGDATTWMMTKMLDWGYMNDALSVSWCTEKKEHIVRNYIYTNMFYNLVLAISW